MLWNSIDLILHFNFPAAVIRHLHSQHAEVCAAQVQSQEITFLWKGMETKGERLQDEEVAAK